MIKQFAFIGMLLVLGAVTQLVSAEPQQLNVIRGEINLLNQDGQARKQRSNIAVFIEGVQAPVDTAVHSENLHENPGVSQRGRRFRPGTLPVEKGTTVDFHNDDRVLHNVFSLSKNQPFDLGNYEHGTSRSVTFDNPGLVKVFCNLHSKMVLNVLVLDNPLYATTNSDGEFVIENIPDGTYTMRVWHEFSDEKSVEVTVAGSEVKTVNIDLMETRSFVQHKNKFGKDYRGKY